MQKKRILLIEHDKKIASTIQGDAEGFGYQLDVEENGIMGFRVVERKKPDLVIIGNLELEKSGIAICKKIKGNTILKNIPVVLIFENEDENEVLEGFDAGADDCFIKPFSAKVFFSKIKSMLKRKRDLGEKHAIIGFGDFVLDIKKYLLKRGSKSLALTLSEFIILKKLLVNKGEVLSRGQLLDDINSDALVIDRNIDVHVASLRKKLGPKFHAIETVRGIGYRFKEEEVSV